MTDTRPPAVAGQFYPADSQELATEVQELLMTANKAALGAAAKPGIKAIIAPHAGYIYSGPIAASVYRTIQPLAGKIKKVVLVGPAHRLAFEGLALPDSQFFSTPLGKIPVDQESVKLLKKFPQIKFINEAHKKEHSLEVHLPFLQEILGEFSLIPLAVGEATAEDVGEILEALWGGDETLIVISSDLSHYHDYDTAKRLDQSTSEAIMQLDPNRIGYEEACGADPVNGLLFLAKKHALKPALLDLRNSGDTAGSRDSVVGYGAYAFYV